MLTGCILYSKHGPSLSTETGAVQTPYLGVHQTGSNSESGYLFETLRQALDLTRFAEIPALELIAIHTNQKPRLFQCFNALRRYGLAQAMRHLDHAMTNRSILPRRDDVSNKATIYF